jgi:hypothetical protein
VPDYHVAPDAIDRWNLNSTMPLPHNPGGSLSLWLAPPPPAKDSPSPCVCTSRNQKYSTDAGSGPADRTPIMTGGLALERQANLKAWR